MAQQGKAQILRICKKLSNKYHDDFEGFINDTINFDGLNHKGLTFQQIEISEALMEEKNVCVSAGGGIGKSALAALLTIWFLPTHLFSRVPTTAPSKKQLKDVLWAEIAFWMNRFKYKEIFELFSERLIIRGFPEWYAVARTVPKDGDAQTISGTLAGFHGKGKDDLLFLVDEASAVADPVFTAIEGAMTSGAYVLLISNPVSTGGYYYDTIFDPDGKGAAYKVLYYDARTSPLVDKEFAQRIIDRYGKDSAMYITKVTGRPTGKTSAVVVAPERFDRITTLNRQRFEGPIRMSVDVGGGGQTPDPAVFCHKMGNSIIRWDEFGKCNPTDVSNETIRIWKTHYQGKDFKVIVDGIGVGAGVVSNLQAAKLFPVIPFIGSEKSKAPHMYHLKRHEGFYELSKNFDLLHFPATVPERLKKELANLFFDISGGPISMEPKKKFVARLGFSPDHADALMMVNSESIASGLATAPHVPKKRRPPLRVLNTNDRYKEKYSKFLGM